MTHGFSCTSGNGSARVAWAHYLGAMLFDAAAIAIASGYLGAYRAQARLDSRNRARARAAQQRRARSRSQVDASVPDADGEDVEEGCPSTTSGVHADETDGKILRFIRT